MLRIPIRPLQIGWKAAAYTRPIQTRSSRCTRGQVNLIDYTQLSLSSSPRHTRALHSQSRILYTPRAFVRTHFTHSKPWMAAPIPTQSKDPKPDEYRLPTNVKPTHYDVTVRTDLEKLTFDGVVTAHLEVQQETQTITLHTADLTLDGATVYSDALKSEQTQPELITDKESERTTIRLPGAPLPAGSKARVTMPFAGVLTGSMLGYYRATWKHDGQTKYYTLTQFEPTMARRAFPCWDEPALKATFAITLVSNANTVNLSNMPVATERPYHTDAVAPWLAQRADADTAGKWKITTFETTPPMSTYLVAFANGDFSYLESTYTSPLSGKVRPLRLYTTPDLIHQGQFALDVKRKVLPLYEKLFDIEYPLPKLDTLVASDFDSGAMENWGLITGRTTAFLIDPTSASLASKKNVASTQSHEVAHMWFGNIATMEWWDTLYLNEGFASLVGEFIILDKVFPEWKLNSAFISGDLSEALNLDAKLSSHPIEVECPDANMANQLFDSLSYAKAASVLRMLLNYVGEERFLKGVSIYLKKHLYANSVTKGLWDGIETATGLDVPKMMDNWVKKMGYPVVTVTEVEGGIRVRQDRFLETGPAEPKDNETIWTIPLSLLTVSDNGKVVIDKEIVLDEREKFISLDTSKPFKVNAGTTGVYRVLYTPERLLAIATEAAQNSSTFSLDDRLGLVQDAQALAKAGFARVSNALDLVDALRAEKEYLVLDTIGTDLAELVSTWWEKPEIKELLNGLRRELFVPIVRRLTYEYSDTDSADTRQLRTVAIGTAASAGHKETIEELRRRFAHLVKTGEDSQIPADLEGIIYSTAVKYGGREEYEAVKGIVAKAKTPGQKTAAIRAMGATQDLKIAEETFQYILDEARDQDLHYFFIGLRSNLSTRRFLVEAFRKHYDVFNKRLEGNFAMIYLVKYSHSALSTEKDYEETVEFFQDKDTSKFAMALQQSLDNIRSRAAFIERSSTDILEWFKGRQGDIHKPQL